MYDGMGTVDALLTGSLFLAGLSMRVVAVDGQAGPAGDWLREYIGALEAAARKEFRR